MKVEFRLDIGYGRRAGQFDVLDFPELDEMENEEEIKKFLEREWQTWVWEYVDGGWDIIE